MFAKLMLLPLVLAAADAKKPSLAGAWKATSVEVDGKDALEGQEVRLLITAKTIKLEIGAGDPKAEPQFTYKLDDSTDPKLIDVIFVSSEDKGTVLEGIYELSGDQLRICICGPGVKERPTEFAGKGGAILLTLKRAP